MVRLPARSRNLNVFAERFVLSIKSECLERMVPLERNHQGLANALINGAENDSLRAGPIVRRDRYHRRAGASGRAD